MGTRSRRFAPLRAPGNASTRLLDPPAFAKSRAAAGAALRGYHEMAQRCLAPGGTLLTASCSFHVQLPEFSRCSKELPPTAGGESRFRCSGNQGHPEVLAIPETGYLRARCSRRCEALTVFDAFMNLQRCRPVRTSMYVIPKWLVMLSAAEIRGTQQRRRSPYSEKQHYQEYILQRIEGYKNSIDRDELLPPRRRGGERAAERGRGTVPAD